MKKISYLVVLVGLVMFITSTAFSLTKNKSSRNTTDEMITYVVEVNNQSTNSFCQSYYVIITDDRGNAISFPRMYHAGIDTYVFHEYGPVSGSRVARFVEIDHLNSFTCGEKVYAIPDAIVTNFRKGASYLFNLYPVKVPGED